MRGERVQEVGFEKVGFALKLNGANFQKRDLKRWDLKRWDLSASPIPLLVLPPGHPVPGLRPRGTPKLQAPWGQSHSLYGPTGGDRRGPTTSVRRAGGAGSSSFKGQRMNEASERRRDAGGRSGKAQP